jgi:Protein of unknown function (DUF2911)
MNKVTMNRLVMTLAVVLASASLWAQGIKSPPATATGKAGDANVTITYNSPGVKGRTVWGSLVPYGQAWRAGADKATTVMFDKAVKIEGKDLAAGKYSLFAIVNENEWTFIFNSETDQWGIKRSGEANYDPAKNVLTVSVKPKKSASMNERLVYLVEKPGIILRWDNLEVPIAVK